MRWPIRRQILIPFVATMLVALVSVSLLNAWLSAWAIERRIAQQLRDIAHTLDESTFPLTASVLRQMHGLSGADFFVSDADGRVSVASRPQVGRLPVAGMRDDWRQLVLSPVEHMSDGQYYQMALKLERRSPWTDEREATRVLHILYPADELGGPSPGGLAGVDCRWRGC